MVQSCLNQGPGLPVEIIPELGPICLRLSEDALLTRYLDGKTQNQNEALNWTIWERVAKEVFVGADTLELRVNDAVSLFNIGSRAALNTLTNNGIEPGEFCREEMKRSDKLRLGKAIYKETDASKRKRKLLRPNRKQKGDQAQEKGVTYASGSF